MKRAFGLASRSAAACAAAVALALAFGSAPAAAGGSTSISIGFGFHSGKPHLRPHAHRHFHHRHFQHWRFQRHPSHFRTHRWHRPPPRTHFSFRHHVIVPPPPRVVYVQPPPPPPPLAVYPASPVYRTAQGQYCREYQTTVTIDGRPQPSYGTACQRPDGSWEIVR